MKKVQGNDSFQRMNYLYQISKYISDKNPYLSSYYGNLIVNVAKKNVLKMIVSMENRDTWSTLFYESLWEKESVKRHPEVKRQMCKRCKCMLKNNVTAKMKIHSQNNRKMIIWTCNICGAKRKLPITKNKDYTLWLERPEAVVEVIS